MVKVTGLTSLSSISTDDIFLIVDDPSGTPTSKKIAWSAILGTSNTFTVDQIIATTKKLGLNAGLTTYLIETSSGIIDIYANSILQSRLDGNQPSSHGISHPAGISQHSLTKKFVDYFSGTALNAAWTKVDFTGTGSSTLVTGINGGLVVTTGASTNDASGITLGNICHFDPANCVIYGIVKRDVANSRVGMGLSSGAQINNTTHNVLFWSPSDGTYLYLQTSDGTTASTTDTDVANTTSKVPFKIVCGASNVKLYLLVSGIWTLKITKTTNRPTSACQPIGAVYSLTASAKTGTLIFTEVQNDS